MFVGKKSYGLQVKMSQMFLAQTDCFTSQDLNISATASKLFAKMTITLTAMLKYKRGCQSDESCESCTCYYNKHFVFSFRIIIGW